MTCKTDLIALRDAVAAGKVRNDSKKAKWTDFDYEGEGYAFRVNANAANAYNGSVDAALAFLVAVLPGWRIEEMHMKWSGTWYANLERESDLAICTATAETPARALLIATLNAMIGGE